MKENGKIESMAVDTLEKHLQLIETIKMQNSYLKNVVDKAEIEINISKRNCNNFIRIMRNRIKIKSEIEMKQQYQVEAEAVIELRSTLEELKTVHKEEKAMQEILFMQKEEEWLKKVKEQKEDTMALEGFIGRGITLKN